MPTQTQDAVNWALQQTVTIDGDVYHVSKDTPQMLVDKVCEYFATSKVAYGTFSYDDLQSYL